MKTRAFYNIIQKNAEKKIRFYIKIDNKLYHLTPLEIKEDEHNLYLIFYHI